MITNNPYSSYHWFVQPIENSINFQKTLVVVDTINRITFLAYFIKNPGRKYGSSFSVLVNIYTTMIIGPMRGVLFFSLNQKFIIKKNPWT